MPRKYNKREKAAQKKAWLNDPNARIPSNIPYNVTSNWDAFSSESAAKLLEKQGDTEFIKKGGIVVEPDGQKNFARTDAHGNTMMHSAANENNELFIIGTIKGVQNKNPSDNDGMTPLHIAATKGNLRICELIIEHVKDKNPKNREDQTPLHYASIS